MNYKNLPASSFASPQGIYTYEFKIPLQKSNFSDYAIGAQPGQSISIGLKWGDIKMGDRKSMMKQIGGGGMIPPPGGGMGGRPQGGSGGRGMQQPKKQEIWLKTQLASPMGG